MLGVEVLLGMDIIYQLGGGWSGVTVSNDGVKFWASKCVMEKLRNDIEKTEKKGRMGIEDQDFQAEFDGKEGMLKWIWKGEPLTLTK